MIESILLPHAPQDLPVYAALFTDVTNAEFLRSQLLEGNEEFEYAFIDATTILSRRHVFAAVFRALNDYTSSRLKSRNVHSETVFCLSSKTNIGEAFRQFGISDTTKELLVLKVPTKPGVTAESVEKHLEQNVQGTPVPFDDDRLRTVTDLAKLRKIHKLGSAGQTGKGAKKAQFNGGAGAAEAGDERTDVEVQVLGLMALRGAT